MSKQNAQVASAAATETDAATTKAAQTDTKAAQADTQAAQAEIARLQVRVTELEAELKAAKAAAKATEKEAGHPQAGKGTHIRVAALADGYFRAGQQFSRQARELAVKDFSPEQLAAIRSDSRLVVVDL